MYTNFLQLLSRDTYPYPRDQLVKIDTSTFFLFNSPQRHQISQSVLDTLTQLEDKYGQSFSNSQHHSYRVRYNELKDNSYLLLYGGNPPAGQNICTLVSDLEFRREVCKLALNTQTPIMDAILKETNERGIRFSQLELNNRVHDHRFNSVRGFNTGS